MRTEFKRFIMWIAFLVGGFLLATLLLLGITGGFLVGTIGFLLIVASLATLSIANGITSRRLAKEPPPTHEALATEVEAEVIPAPMVARVTEATGVCVMGYEYRGGEFWSVNGKAEGAHTLCPVLEAKLLEAGNHLLEAGDGRETETVICEAKDHKVVIELTKRELEAVNE